MVTCKFSGLDVVRIILLGFGGSCRTSRFAGTAAVGSDVAVSRRRLEEALRTLRIVLDILVVSDMALRLQGAERDEEIAEVLRHCGSYRLQGVIEEMEGVVVSQ